MDSFESDGEARGPTFSLSGTSFRVNYHGPVAQLAVERVDGTASADLGMCEAPCTLSVVGPIDAGDYFVHVIATEQLGAPWGASVEEQG